MGGEGWGFSLWAHNEYKAVPRNGVVGYLDPDGNWHKFTDEQARRLGEGVTAENLTETQARDLVAGWNSSAPRTFRPNSVPVPEGHTRVYRAVSDAEYQDILATGRLQQGRNSLEGKWFADSLEGAKAHGRVLFPDGKFRLIEVDVPDNAPSLFRQPNLDGLGPARYLHLDDLNNVTPRPLQ